VLAFLVYQEVPLSREDLINLLASSEDENEVTKDTISFAIDRLMPVMTSVGADDFARPCHKSFLDFMTDIASLLDRDTTDVSQNKIHTFLESRSPEWTRSKQQCRLTQACLQLMNKSLKFNICGIQTSYGRNDDIPGIVNIIKENITLSLEYACQYWGVHLEDIDEAERGIFLRQMRPHLDKFFGEHALHWMEVLSVTESIGWGAQSLRCLSDSFKEIDSAFSSLVSEASKFLSSVRTVIATSVPHIYISALPFAPKNSRFANAISTKTFCQWYWDMEIGQTTAILTKCSVQSLIRYY